MKKNKAAGNKFFANGSFASGGGKFPASHYKRGKNPKSQIKVKEQILQYSRGKDDQSIFYDRKEVLARLKKLYAAAMKKQPTGSLLVVRKHLEGRIATVSTPPARIRSSDSFWD